MAAREVDYLLIGGGLASANCARWLREEGAAGEVLLVGREPDPPYNRPDCSKGYLRGEETREQPLFRPHEWWSQQQVELLTRASVTGLDLATRTATLSSKEQIVFGKALLATGANVRRLNVDGCQLEHIYYLRTLANADAIREGVARAERVAVRAPGSRDVTLVRVSSSTSCSDHHGSGRKSGSSRVSSPRR